MCPVFFLFSFPILDLGWGGKIFTLAFLLYCCAAGAAVVAGGGVFVAISAVAAVQSRCTWTAGWIREYARWTDGSHATSN